MGKKRYVRWLLAVSMLVMCFSLTACAGSSNTTKQTAAVTNNSAATAVNEVNKMNVEINGKSYAVTLDQNKTVEDILGRLPLDMSMVKFADHEYYAKLPFTPVFDENRTSQIKAGHIYYWDGWNAFVINYIDYDIEPYKVVHIGKIDDEEAVTQLLKGEENIRVKVTGK